MDLITAFADAARKWELRHGEGDIAFWLFFWTGAPTQLFDPVGRADLTGLTKAEIGQLPYGRIHGHHTAEHATEWLRQLQRKSWRATFLVPAVVRAIDFELERLAEGYAKGKRRGQRSAAEMRATYNDPEALDETLRQMNERLRNEPEYSGEEFTADRFLAMVERAEEWSRASLLDLKQRHDQLVYWRELTAALTDPDVIEAAKLAELGLPPDEDD